MNLGAISKWTFFSVLAVLVAWRIVAIGMSDHFTQAGAPDAAAALQWRSSHPDALFAQGLQIAQQDPDQAIAYLEQAIRENPADGRSYVLLGRIWEVRDDLAKADKAMEAAGQMAPQRTDVQAEVAAYWMRRSNLTRALQHWDVVLAFRHDLRAKLFPDMLRLAEDPRNLPAFARLIESAVTWWPAFIEYAASNAIRLDTLRALFHLQDKTANKATGPAMRAYLARLEKEGHWTEAYFVWLNSLPKEQLVRVDNLFNGGFEQPLSNLGFDWIHEPADHVLIEPAVTYGCTGNRALHVVFRGSRARFRHLHQSILLPPGTYILRGRARPESLETSQGVEWAVHCQGKEEALGRSERFLGSDHWRHFAFRFEVPPQGCEVQELRLELAGRVALDYEARGGIWFDDLGIERSETY